MSQFLEAIILFCVIGMIVSTTMYFLLKRSDKEKTLIINKDMVFITVITVIGLLTIPFFFLGIPQFFLQSAIIVGMPILIVLKGKYSNWFNAPSSIFYRKRK